jgi:cytochrome b subunit of formate dehydrogenase
VTASCADCHTAHHELPRDNPESSINKKNIPHTCAKCHNGIFEQFARSIHYQDVAKTDKPLPMCDDCHSSHDILRTDQESFKLEIINQCGRCHKDVTESYFETYHGKVSKLGYTGAAKCYDCHGAHDILPNWYPNSHLSRQNIVQTCAQCHQGSHRRFAGYLTHATHHDREKYPALFYTFWFMTILLVSTLTFFGIHTILWLPRSFQALKEHKAHKIESQGKEVLRFKSLHRRLHILVIISFLGLALTGMTLKFSYLGWAQWLSRVMGGFESAGFIHRVCAIITFFYFAVHIIDMIREKIKSGQTWRQMFTGSNSMLPNLTDLKELIGTFKWFIGLGSRPEYGRYTYWEKFDYFAVFWGVAIIGMTGLILWFPQYFTYILPGWIINVATIIHSDEALLAVGFIFTVHFFNTHFRPDKFPMDTVIFTGRVPLEEFKKDRPREYQDLVESGELESNLVDPLPPIVVRGLKIFGAIALSIGLILVVLIIFAQIFGYR